MEISIDELNTLRRYFESGATRPYEWRRQQLQRLLDAIIARENDIHRALHADLHKSPEEAYATETGLVLAEIRYMLRHLRQWMRPRRVWTNLVNLPASSFVYRDPLGVVLVIAPWNYPFQLSVLPVAAALAGGNTAVLKPSELAPATAAIIEKILTDTFPPEVVRVIPGDGATIVPELVRSFRFDHIFFTGSMPVGRSIYRLAAEQLIPVTLELGGKSPAIVAEDADLRIAARRIIVGKFTNAGQTCVAPDYVLAHTKIKATLLQYIREGLVQFYGEHPAASGDFGRIINHHRFDRLVSYLDQGHIIHGGDYDREALYIAPTILDEVTPGTPLMQEEIFGPLLPIVTFGSREEAMEIVRQNPNPLAFYLFTNDRREQRAWIDSLSFGGGCINNTDWHFMNPHLPFGGIGNSGIGAYHGKYSFERFTHVKGMLRSATFIDPGIKYPPFKGKMKWFKFFIR